ncbi:MAG: UpxY family transcription antiterminator [Bacteroidota bacterium]
MASSSIKQAPKKPDPDQPRWLVVYTSPRCEKKAHDECFRRNIISYCPLTRARRRWSDRTKIVTVPLFRSYLFVRVTEEERSAVLRVPGVLRFVYYNRLPAVVLDSEIEIIRQFLREHQEVTARAAGSGKDGSLAPGTPVVVTAGLMMGGEGTVIEVRNREVKVLIQSLGQELIATLDPEVLKPDVGGGEE